MKTPPRQPPPPRRAHAVEEALRRCRNLATVAHLLRAPGRGGHAEPLDAELIMDAGQLILRETGQLEEALHSLGRS